MVPLANGSPMNTDKTKLTMCQGRCPGAGSRSGVALLITLMTLALMTIIVVALLGTMSWEMQASRRNFESQKARGIAILGLHTAVSQLRIALGQWDAPYGNEGGNLVGNAMSGFLTNSPSPTNPNGATNFWSVSPGILTSWSYLSTTPYTNYPLFSLPQGAASTTPLANLNAQGQDGVYPILGSPTPLNVYWVSVLANPTSSTASSANPIVGRYAFWVDDENSKININTADGVLNTNYPSTYMGAGTPTEVSLMELTNSAGGNLTFPAATNIVAYARTNGFNSPRDILHFAATTWGSSFDLYTNNIFNLTMFSRSPDINIFGQPKMALIPANVLGLPYQNLNNTISPSLLWNLATLQPLKELFPSVGGTGDSGILGGVLPPITLKDYFYTISQGAPNLGTITPTIYSNLRRPVVFLPGWWYNSFNNQPLNGNCSPWSNGKVIANYLAGTNATANASGIGNPVTWPPFPGSSPSATSYLNKYTAHQIDEIAVQIVDLVSKDTTPDAITSPGESRTAGFITRGWLSQGLVSGIGRGPKLDKILMEYQTKNAKQVIYPAGVTNNVPSINAKLWMEMYFPSRFSGVSLFHENIVYGGFSFGDFVQSSMMNCQDWEGNDQLTNPGSAGNALISGQPALLPKLPNPPPAGIAGPPTGNLGAPIGNTPVSGNFSYWGNNLLRTDQGVDWNGNCESWPDPDQALAAMYHPYLFQTNGTPNIIISSTNYFPNTAMTASYATTNISVAGTYLGAGISANSAAPIFLMNGPVNHPRNNTSSNIMDDWAPGEYRVVENVQGPLGWSLMSTNAAVAGQVNIYGGVAYKPTINSGAGANPDPVPLDSVRGSDWPNVTVNNATNNCCNSALGIGAQTTIAINAYTAVGSPGIYGELSATGENFITNTLTPYTNVLNAVIPMAATVPVPSTYGPAIDGPVYVYASVKQGDFLVNKYPGDWNISSGPPSSSIMNTVTGLQPDGSNCSITKENGNTQGQMTGDPDAFWLPTIDNITGLNYVYLSQQNSVPQPANLSSITLDSPQMPRTARFPSIGYLQYVRTGIIPDDETQPYAQQHGTPYRLLDFSPSYQWNSHSQTILNSSYPDWAMLDLFFMPSSLLGYGSPYEQFAGTRTITPNTYAAVTIPPTTNNMNNPIITYSNTNAINTMFQYGTYGGATSGRINPNGSVVYTTNVNIPTPGITRTVPLRALLHGLVYNQTQQSPYGTTVGNPDWLGTNDFHVPVLSPGTAVIETAIAQDIANYLTTNQYGNTDPSTGNIGPAPLKIPAEICNMPTVAACASPVNATRNDLVRQIVGNLTTQSNTFSVWVAGQSIVKSKTNLASDATSGNYGVYEPGDQITGSVRYHFIVERDFDSGTDSVYGNSTSPGGYGIVGTLDDVFDQAGINPRSPDYFYRIIYAEEIR